MVLSLWSSEWEELRAEAQLEVDSSRGRRERVYREEGPGPSVKG